MRLLARVAIVVVLSTGVYLSGVRLISQVVLPTDVSSLWETSPSHMYPRKMSLQTTTKVLSAIDPFSCDYIALQSGFLLATDQKGAREASRKALIVGLANPESWVAAGMAALNEGDMQEGFALCGRALDLDQDRADTRFKVGLALSDHLPYVPAADRDLYRNLAELNLVMAASLAPLLSWNPCLCLAMAELRAEEGDKRSVLAWAKRIPTEPPIDWTLTVRKMAVCFSVGENVEAVSTWKKATRYGVSLTEAERIRREMVRHPSVPDFAYILAELYTREGNTNRARMELEGLIRVRPNVAEYRLALGDTFAKLGRYDQAGVCYEEAAKLSPANAEVRNKLVEYYSGAGQ